MPATASADARTGSQDERPVRVSAGKPNAATTGVPKGTKLTRRNGDITVTTPGAVLDGLDIRGFVTVKAPDVTIRNSIIRGGKATYNRGLVTNYGYDDLLIEDTDFIPSHETVWQDGIKGWDFTARRVHIRGNVDSVKVQGDDVRIVGSLLEDTVRHANDPNQGGGASHNDGIQIQKGVNVSVVRNTIRGHSNFAILGAAAIGRTVDLAISHNWVNGGHCTVKLQEHPGYSLSARVNHNLFGPNRKVDCPLVATRNAEVAAKGNVLTSTGRPVRVYKTDS